MLQLPRTLRFRLILLYVASFALLQMTLAFMALSLRRSDLMDRVDTRLVERARTVLDLYHAGPPGAGQLDDILGEPVVDETVLIERTYAQLRDENLNIGERSDNLEGLSLPWPSAPPSSTGSWPWTIETIPARSVSETFLPNQKLRIVTMRRPQSGISPQYAQVAASLAGVQRRVDSLMRIFLTLIPGALVAAGAISWWLVQRSLSPIGRIAREARELTAAHLDRRIAMPRGKDEVAEMVETINEMLERLESAFRAQERFIANAAHELKTPLSVLLAQTQVLTQRPRDVAEYQQFAVGVTDEARRLAQITDSLLMLARADAGLPLPRLSSISINEVVADSVQRCHPESVQRRVRVVTKLLVPQPDRQEPTVLGDPELLRTMLSNLLRNALRHSPTGEPVGIDLRQQGASIMVAVRDHGPGIPPQFADQLFERFFQLKRDGTETGGTGLGLAIARGIARLHHGDIRVRNITGAGCEFTVELPMEAEHASFAETPQPQ